MDDRDFINELGRREGGGFMDPLMGMIIFCPTLIKFGLEIPFREQISLSFAPNRDEMLPKLSPFFTVYGISEVDPLGIFNFLPTKRRLGLEIPLTA
jgi:hypothetical protein